MTQPTVPTNEEQLAATKTQERLAHAAHMAIVAWYWKVDLPSQDAPGLRPEYMPDPLSRAAWQAIVECNDRCRFTNYEQVKQRAREIEPASDAQWQSFWKRVESTPLGIGYVMKASATELIYHWKMEHGEPWIPEPPPAPPTLLPSARTPTGLRPPPPDALRIQNSEFGILQERVEDDRFKVHPASEALEPLPPIEWLVEGLLAPGDVSQWFGKPGSGKTFALMWLSVCIANGRDWLGFKTRKSPVLIVDEESGTRRMRQRIGDMLRATFSPRDLPLGYIVGSHMKLCSPEDMARLAARIDETGAQLVLIDSLSKVSSGDENTKQAAQVDQDALQRLAREKQVHVAVIHHSGKSGVQRGSSVYDASPDIIMHVLSERGSRYMEFRTEKIRDAEPLSFAAMATWVVHPEDPNLNQFYMERVEVRKRSDAEGGLSEAEEYVLDYLSEHGEIKLRDITDHAETCSREVARQAVYSLVKMDLVHRTNREGSGRGKTALYALTESGEERMQGE